MSGPYPRTIIQGDIPHGFLDILESIVARLSLKVGFTSIELPCLSILTNLYMSFIESIASKSLGYAESACRSKLVLNDLILAFADFGFDLSSLTGQHRHIPASAFKEPACIGNASQRRITCEPVPGPGGVIVIPRTLNLRSEGSGVLAVSGRAGGGSGIVPGVGASRLPGASGPLPKAPTHLFLPPAPEPHTYITTKVARPPTANTTTVLRRQIIDQKRKVQLSLTKFLSHIQPVHALFPGDFESFPILIPQGSSRPYLSALLADSIPECQEGNRVSAMEEEVMQQQQSQQQQRIRRSTNTNQKSTTNSQVPISSTASETTAKPANYFLQKPIFPNAELVASVFI